MEILFRNKNFSSIEQTNKQTTKKSRVSCDDDLYDHLYSTDDIFDVYKPQQTNQISFMRLSRC